MAGSVLTFGALGAACTGELGSPFTASSAPVQGSVIDADGEPVANVQVELGATLVHTDTEGRFTVPSAPPRYDAAIATADGSRGYVFRGLGSRTPTLRLFDVSTSLRSESAHVRATLAAPLAKGATLSVFLACNDPSVRIASSAPKADGGDIDIDVRWIGPARAQVDVTAVAYLPSDTTAAPSRYLGVATARDVRVDAGATSRADLAFEEVAERTVVVRPKLPGYSVEWTSLVLDLGGGARAGRLSDSLESGDEVSFLVPDLAGAAFRAEVNAYGPSGSLSTAASGEVGAGGQAEVAMAAAPVLLAPADGEARVNAATTFSWDAAPSAVSWVYFGPEDQSREGAPRIWVATPDAETTLPDLHSLGVSLDPSASSMWYVVLARGASRVEDAAEAGLFADAPGVGGSTRARKFGLE